MQNTALGVLAWELTESSSFLGLVIFAQLGPFAVLSLVGGSMADTMDRRKLLLGTQFWQMAWSFVLAAMVIDDQIGEGALLLVVFIIGLGQGIFAPAFTSVLPSLAGRRNLPAAIALNSAQVNAARVLGPAIGGVLTSQFGFAEVFAINAASYIIVIIALWMTPMPSPEPAQRSLSDRLFGGFKVVFRAPQVGGPILTMTAFSFLCLPFLGQLPAIAEVNLGIDAQSTQYGWFYALFGAGALAGALGASTVFLRVPRPLMLRLTLHRVRRRPDLVGVPREHRPRLCGRRGGRVLLLHPAGDVVDGVAGARGRQRPRPGRSVVGPVVRRDGADRQRGRRTARRRDVAPDRDAHRRRGSGSAGGRVPDALGARRRRRDPRRLTPAYASRRRAISFRQSVSSAPSKIDSTRAST